MSIRTLEDVRKGGHALVAVCRNAGCRSVQKVDIPLLLKRVDPQSPLLPQRHTPHFTDVMRCSSCRWRGVNLWVDLRQVTRPIFKRSALPKQPNFTIVDHGDAPYSGHEVIATADNLMVGRGAYTAAALFYQDRRITLKQGAFVMFDSKDGKPVDVISAERYGEMRQGEDEMARRSAGAIKAS